MTSAARRWLALAWLLAGCPSEPDDDAAPGQDASAGLDAQATDAGDDASATADGGDAGAGRCGQMPEGRVALPADDAWHDEPVEWWYWTGHLRTAEGRWFGFEHVFFLARQQGRAGRIAHTAVTDVQQARFSTYEALAEGLPPVVADGFELDVELATATGGGGHDVLHGEAEGVVLDLELEAIKPPVLQHGTGYTDYPFGGYTYYYSRERMATQGTVLVDGEPLAVSGTAWFDHQWGEIGPAVDHGWDWYALQLDDERELMLFVVRVEGVQALAGGTFTDAGCESTELEADDLEITPTDEWVSPETGCTYPSGWQIDVPGLSVTVTPVLDDQEMAVFPTTYWEGAAVVEGDATGRAYVELTGYCD